MDNKKICKTLPWLDFSGIKLLVLSIANNFSMLQLCPLISTLKIVYHKESAHTFDLRKVTTMDRVSFASNVKKNVVIFAK